MEIKKLAQSIKKLLFSQKCPICKCLTQTDNYICDSCYKDLRKKGNIKNQKNYYYLYYYNEDIKSLIADFKLKNRRGLGSEIASLMRRPIKELVHELDIDVVIPVPISKKRELERGFNQVEELLDKCGIEYQKIQRKKDTRHMYELLDKNRRKENIFNAFRNEKISFEGKNILIVDDIVTTGSTIKEMIREIERNGTPKSINIFSLAVSKIFKP